MTAVSSPADDRSADNPVAKSAKVQRRLKRLSWLMDNSIRLPTGHRIGIDGLVGFIPGVGDLFGAAVSSYFIVTAVRMGVPKPVVGRMGANVLMETVLGAIPLLGDLFDLAFKANVRNYQLLEQYFEKPEKTRRTSTAVLGGSILGVVAILALGLFLAVGFMLLVWRLITGA